jgi:hypothetical protein
MGIAAMDSCLSGLGSASRLAVRYFGSGTVWRTAGLAWEDRDGSPALEVSGGIQALDNPLVFGRSETVSHRFANNRPIIGKVLLRGSRDGAVRGNHAPRPATLTILVLLKAPSRWHLSHRGLQGTVTLRPLEYSYVVLSCAV